MGVAREIVEIYRQSKKKKDINLWTEWVCRPPAAVFVWLLRNTRVTPNQVTFFATAIAAASAALFVVLPGWRGAIIAAVVFEISFVFDCVDGQLARLRKTSSVIGHHLDFLMDEIKAFVIFGAVAIRLWYWEPDWELAQRYLLVGIGGLACLGSGLSLTTFMRRPEYAGAAPPTAEGQPVELPKRRGPIGLAISLVERAARFVVHYPSYILIVALIPPGRLDLYFWAYAAVNLLYAGRSFLSVLVKLGRFSS
jgi:hypothetical protein